jgi:hypothetical protein
VAHDGRTAPDRRGGHRDPARGQAGGGLQSHIGDIGYDGTEGGRLLLPLECYVPGRGNSCGTGAIGVADPRTLAWRYYVRLSPTEITKAMWVEPAPDGGLLWTSSGSDLLAYRAAAVSSSNAAALPITAAYRLGGAVPASGVSGATFWRGRLLLAGQQGPRYQLWAVDLASGRRTLELELRIRGESEGLHAMSTLGGELHWLIAPFDLRGPATYGRGSALLHFVPARGRAGLRVSLSARPRGGRLVVAVRVLRRRRPVAGAHVTFGGRFARTDGRGRAELAVVLPRAGRYRALARKGLLRGLSGWVFVRPAPPAGGAAARRSGGG